MWILFILISFSIDMQEDGMPIEKIYYPEMINSIEFNSDKACDYGKKIIFTELEKNGLSHMNVTLKCLPKG